MKSNSYLFLDDTRRPDYISKQPTVPKNVKWTVVRDYNDFVNHIKYLGIPNFISYDHDLCLNAVKEFIRAHHSKTNFNYSEKMKKTGMDCLLYTLEYCEKNDIPHPPYFIHSSNYICAEDMKQKIEEYNKRYANK